ncbi:hypothetical protein AAKU52_002205 [Pedobacter sp. CG_S7]|uniref:T9SS type A sorting domain-containing protein n=1 Tax=Pedobacter sp. CG_S7 TaxID=3143930 RepID=UPI003395717E
MKAQVLWVAFVCFFLNSAEAQIQENRLTLRLTKDVFSDSFLLVFKENGKEAIDDQDAQKIGDGYVSISSLHSKEIKLAIEERAYPTQNIEMALFVKGYETGYYHLFVEATDFKGTGIRLTLYDKLLNKKTPILFNGITCYGFTIDLAVLESQGGNRFSMQFNKVSKNPSLSVVEGALMAFPNPFRDNLFLDVKDNHTPLVEIRLKDLMGRIVWRREFNEVQKNDVLTLEGLQLIPGMYLLEWRDRNDPKKFKTLKIMKH